MFDIVLSCFNMNMPQTLDKCTANCAAQLGKSMALGPRLASIIGIKKTASFVSVWPMGIFGIMNTMSLAAAVVNTSNN